MNKNITIWFVVVFIISLAFIPFGVAEKDFTCTVYFTGVGCPHCAKTDPVVLKQLPREYPNLVIIEYEIYQQRINAPLLSVYNKIYKSGLGVPLIIFNKKVHMIGDLPILKQLRKTIMQAGENECPIGKPIKFDQLNLTSLPGKPKIWRKERILIKKESGRSDKLINLLIKENLTKALEKIEFEIIEPTPVPLSGQQVNFENAIKLDGWIFQWNGKPSTEKLKPTEQKINKTISEKPGEALRGKLTLPKITSLAAVDAINPCALAVSISILIGIISYNPKKRRNILFTGLAFSTSIFVMYLVYGLIIIRFFQVIQALTGIKLLLYKTLGVVGIGLGLFHAKNFFVYKPGGLGIEMPIRFRPKVKKLVSGITSPKGAFLVGIFVTIFLLPCTVGPYVIAGGILSALELMKTMPWLLLYNAIFISPIIAITLTVYKGFSTIEDVSGWTGKNIRRLHLVAGIVLFFLGIAMLLGLV